MFRGDYNFFDYKYNITGYNGQDYGSFAQYLFLILSVVFLIILLFWFRKCKKDEVLKIIKFIGVFLLLFYITKTTWESIYDIKYTGSFNYGLLPLDACSIVIYASLILGFCKGKIKDYAASWLVTGSIICGLGTMFFLTAFKYYPFLSFGAFYSMTWHFLMLFVGLFLIVTNYIKYDYNVVIKGFIFHILFSLIVVPLDYIFNFDFMFYKELSSIPIFDNVAGKLIESGLGFINPIIMLVLYFIGFNLVYFVIKLIKKIGGKNGK